MEDDDYTEITCKYIPPNPILIINKMNGDEIERVPEGVRIRETIKPLEAC